MAVTNTPETMPGDFKNLYEKMGLVNAIPRWAIIQDKYPFSEAEAGLGNYYVFGVVLTKEHGFTYAPSSGSGSGAVTLNDCVAGYIGQAQVQGYAIYLRSRLSFDAAAKASRAGKKAFAQAYGAVLKNMKESHQYRLELSLLYGCQGLATVSANNTGVLTITSDSWATGIWAAGMQGCVLEAWSTSANPATKHNTDLTITNVNVQNKTITVSGTSSAVVANDVLYFKGARLAASYNECFGIEYILRQTSGLVFSIDSGLYELWRPQQYAVNGNISLTAIMNAAALGMSFGLEKAIMLIAPEKFANLASDEAALRRYVKDLGEVKRGVKGIIFQLGSIDVEILPHPFMKQGISMILAEDTWQRVGATDITASLPGSGEPMQVLVTDTTALELRMMSDQGIYSECPAQNILVTSIT